MVLKAGFDKYDLILIAIVIVLVFTLVIANINTLTQKYNWISTTKNTEQPQSPTGFVIGSSVIAAVNVTP